MKLPVNLELRSNKELVALFNEIANLHGEPLVSRFPSVAAGVKRIRKIYAKHYDVPLPMKANTTQIGDREKVRGTLKKPADRTTIVCDYEKDESRSDWADRIAQSWRRKDVALRRLTRHKVFVNGQEFSSVRAAFVHFDLPLGIHIKFRMKLKEDGARTYASDKYGQLLFVLGEGSGPRNVKV